MNNRRIPSLVAKLGLAVGVAGLMAGAAGVAGAKPKGKGGGGGGPLKVAKKLKGHENSITGLCFLKDGTTLVSGSLDSTVRVWSVTKGGAPKVIKMGEGVILHQVACHPVRPQFSAATSDGVLVYDDSGKQQHKLAFGKNPIEGVAYGPDGDSIVGVSAADGVATWTSDEGAAVKQNAKIKGGRSVAFRPTVPGLVAVGRDGAISLWYPADNTVRDIKTESETASVAFSRDGKMLATFGTDRVVRCFDVAMGKQLWEKGNVANDTRVAWSADGKVVMSGADGDLVKAFVAEDGSDTWEFHVPSPNNTRVVAVSPNGKMLATAGESEILVLTAK